jgi:hypothetical protein
MSRPKTNRAARLCAGALTVIGLGTWLAGCSNADMYLDRRDSIALGAGNAVAANAAQQTVDPWPASSGDKTIAFNGQKMQAAVERYRTDKVNQPEDSQAAATANASAQSVTQVNVGGSSSPQTSTSSTNSPTTGTPAQ